MTSLSGLYRALVKSGGPDPDGASRVLVALPDMSGAPIWARVAQFGAAPGSAAGFLPEAGDEVVIGFFGDDKDDPVVLGSLTGSARAPPAAQAQLRIDFDEDERVLSIATPAGQTLRLNVFTGQITLGDADSNVITMGRDGIAISTTGNLQLQAGGNLSIDCAGALTLQGSGNASLASPRMVRIEGALVKIN